MQPFNNQFLFSDYYLTELVKDDNFWQESFRQAEEAHRKIKEIFQKAGENLTGLNEAETEHRIIRPVLDAIGHIYFLQPSADSPEGIRRPDFAFFADPKAREEAEREHKGKREFFAACLAIGDAKHWDRALDKKTKGSGDPFTNYNPSYQIDFYLRATDCRWGILSNGRLWRLYNRETSYRYDVFYEVDLPALLERSNDLSRYYNEEFNYFFAFFRKEAFLEDVIPPAPFNKGGVSGLSFLDRAYKGSLDYAAKLGEELKENVYEALRLLAEGFLKFPANGLMDNPLTSFPLTKVRGHERSEQGGCDKGDELDDIRENTFVLIYRILFLLYAEDRRFLPVDNPNYQAYSLRNLVHEIAQKLDAGVHLSPTMVGYWSRLIDLFRIINEGDDSLDVPSYNGGLFDDAKHPFLSDYKIGDSYLAQAIDQLTRAQAAGQNPPAPFSKGGSRGFVSYRDMEIRHIGSIYEGLLEHHLRIADEDLAVVREKDREKFIPLASASSPKVGVRGSCRVIKSYPQGSIYLETDRGERKATGSYYTPDYIVKYIVENTVGPLLEEKKKQALERSQNAQKEIESLAKSISAYKAQLSKATLHYVQGQASPFIRKQYQDKIDKEQNRLEALRAQSDPNSLLISEIQQIKVLDPAMGSGHFLVEATDFLARALVEALGASPQMEHPDFVEEVTEEDIRWARREVVERCIYGVDLNPLAVELAKLSLWLYTVSKGRPLSFLEHHLRLGNSLIGAKIEEIGRLPAKVKGKLMVRETLTPALSRRERETEAEYGQQLSLFDESAFTQSAFRMVGGAQNIEKMPTDSVVQVKKKEEILATVLDPIREPYRKIADLWTSAFFRNDISQPVYQQAMSLLQGKTTTLSENVLSPYIARAEELREQKRFFHWELEFPEVFFDEHGRKKGNPGFDVVVGNPPYIMLQNLPDERELFNYTISVYRVAQYKIDTYHLFIENAFVLAHADGFFSYITPNTFLKNKFCRKLRELLLKENSLECIILIPEQVFLEASVDTAVFVVKKGRRENHLVKFKHLDTSLSEIVHITGYNELQQSKFLASDEFSIDLMPQNQFTECFDKAFQDTVILEKLGDAYFGIQTFDRKKFVSVSAKNADWKKTLDGTHINRYEILPANEYVYFAPEAIKSGGDATVYESPKIIVRQIGEFPIAAFDDTQHYCLNTTYNITLRGSSYSIKYVLSVINSTLISAYWRYKFFDYKETFPKIKKAPLLNIPIRRISFTTPKEERERLAEEGKRLCAAWVAAQMEKMINV